MRKIPTEHLVLATAVGLGSLVRLLPFTSGNVPLNDGGLFYRMTEDLIANGFRIPSLTTYNGGGIPFAYPPLGLDLLGVLHLVSGVHLLELMRWLPALFSVLTIPAFYLLARSLIRRDDQAALATLIFALIPRSHEWILMGGGVTRAPGMLFALLTLAQTPRLLERPAWGKAVALGLTLGLVILSHLEMAWFAAFSLLLIVALRGRGAPGLAHVAVAFAIAALAGGAWWIPVVSHHGFSPLLQAAMTGGHTPTSTAAILTNFTGEPFYGFFLLLGLLGGLREVCRRKFLLPIWLLLIILLDPRAAGTDASIPLGMLAAIAILEIVVPSLCLSERERPMAGDRCGQGKGDPGTLPHAYAVAAVTVAAYGLFASMLAPFLPSSAVRTTLRPGELEAAGWINANLPANGRILVVSGREAWEEDPLSEWLPALTDQVSLATPQGKEWLGGLREAAERHRDLQRCAALGVDCLRDWLVDGDVRFDYLLVARYLAESPVQTMALQEGLARSGEYAVLFSNPHTILYSHSDAR